MGEGTGGEDWDVEFARNARSFEGEVAREHGDVEAELRFEMGDDGGCLRADCVAQV